MYNGKDTVMKCGGISTVIMRKWLFLIQTVAGPISKCHTLEWGCNSGVEQLSITDEQASCSISSTAQKPSTTQNEKRKPLKTLLTPSFLVHLCVPVCVSQVQAVICWEQWLKYRNQLNLANSVFYASPYLCFCPQTNMLKFRGIVKNKVLWWLTYLKHTW